MKYFPLPKRNRSHAKRKHHYQKYQSTRQPSEQNRKKVSKLGGSDDYRTA